MKNFLKSMRLLTSLAAISAMLIIGVSCNKDSPSAEEVFLEKIGRAWVLTSAGVEIDGEDVTEVFEDFSVTFSREREYSTSNGNDPIWDSSGTFELEASTNDAGFHIIRDDDVEVRVEVLSDDRLVLKFNFISDGSGRVKSVSGEYTFDLEPE